MPVQTRTRTRSRGRASAEAESANAEATADAAKRPEQAHQRVVKRQRLAPSSSSLSSHLSPSPPPPTRPEHFKQVDVASRPALKSTPVPGVWYVADFLPVGENKGEAAGLSRFFGLSAGTPSPSGPAPRPPPSTPSAPSPAPLDSPSLYAALHALPQWYRPTLRLYGRAITQSRSIIAFSKVPGLKLKYSGVEVDMHGGGEEGWPPPLRRLERRVRAVLGEEVRFNHAMLNLYPDGDTHIGRHSDNLENKVIVTVSLGAPRTWIMTRKLPRAKGNSKTKAGDGKSSPPPPPSSAPERHKWTLEDGSLLLMQGDCQREWTHEIPKERRVKRGRISVTFRQLVYE